MFKNKDLRWRGQEGTAVLIALIFIGFGAITALTVMAAYSNKDLRRRESSLSKFREKWNARSSVNILAQVIKRDAPAQFDSDVNYARRECGASADLPLFDPQQIPSGTQSIAAATFADGAIQCGQNASGATSLLGNVNSWAEARKSVFENTAKNTFGIDLVTTDVVEIREVYRKTFGVSSAESYAVRYIVEGKNGLYQTRTNGEVILGANVPGCGTVISFTANPNPVLRGNPVTITATYAYARKVQLLDGANTVLDEQNVTEQVASQNIVFNRTPVANETYRVVAEGSGGCRAIAAPQNVVVNDPPPPTCPTINSFTTSATEVNNGEPVTISWNVSDATTVTLDGVSIGSVGSQNFTINADRTFTLRADTPGCSQVTRAVSVTVRVVPPCSYATPTIQSFTATQTSIVTGGTTTLTWSITGLESGAQVRVTGPSGFSQTGLSATGSINITPPAAIGDYTYTLVAENVCPDGTRLTSQQNVIIQVRACPQPNIDSYVVNPSTVTQGGNQIIRFTWNISGTVDSVAIDNGVGGGLASSGTLDINQPNVTTTYTITAVGCGVTRQAQVVVTVNAPVLGSSCVESNLDFTFPGPETTQYGRTTIIYDRNVPVGQTTIYLSWNPQPFNLFGGGNPGLTDIYFQFRPSNLGQPTYIVSTNVGASLTSFVISEPEFQSSSKTFTLPFVLDDVESSTTMYHMTYLSANPGETFPSQDTQSGQCLR